MNTLTRISILLLFMAGLSGCASIDFDYPRTESTALTETAETTLGQKNAPAVAAHPSNESGFHPLPDGIDALAARIYLAERAEKSIDLQYYLIKNDLVGRAFLHALMRAADRGVRVRLLLDDVFTSGYDVGMMALSHHPNFEVRIFNPWNRGLAGRALGSVADFGRINRRMHNKSFTVDNQVTIIGGRNIADEYFGAREDVNFGDLDVMAIGPVVREVSAMFDEYWNHETALPPPAFTPPLEDPDAALSALRTSLTAAYEDVPYSQYREAVQERFSKYATAGNDIFEWARYRLVYDSPDKGLKKQDGEIQRISLQLLDELSRAENEMIIISPYFVPRKAGIEKLLAVEERGVAVKIITNSLAANNQFSVHGGYAPSRKPLLEGGVEIYEARPDSDIAGAELVAASGATATLHTKAFVVDRRDVFVGSFNFDPRSANLNTEMGVMIYDHDLAARLADRIYEKIPTDTYEVYLDDDGDLRWRGYDDTGTPFVETKEPETSWWDRFVAGFVRILPIRSQL